MAQGPGYRKDARLAPIGLDCRFMGPGAPQKDFLARSSGSQPAGAKVIRFRPRLHVARPLIGYTQRQWTGQGSPAKETCSISRFAARHVTRRVLIAMKLRSSAGPGPS